LTQIAVNRKIITCRARAKEGQDSGVDGKHAKFLRKGLEVKIRKGEYPPPPEAAPEEHKKIKKARKRIDLTFKNTANQLNLHEITVASMVVKNV
jgi:hypothetical protein